MNIYLSLNGNCHEAFQFYREVFGGEFVSFQTFADGPQEMGVPVDAQSRVMHVSLPLGDSLLMGSDTLPGDAVDIGNNFSIVVPATSRETCDGLFAALADQGQIIMPLAETFWGSYFGRLADRYGINWMFNLDSQLG